MNFDKKEDLLKASKTRYYPVTLEKLFLEIDSKKGKIAVSGVPSFLKAIRLKQFYSPEYKEKICFLIGIICGGWKSTFFTDYLAQKAGILGDYNSQEYRIKDEASLASDYSFGAYDEDKEFHQIKMRKVGNIWGNSLFNANAYDYGDDVTAELADISLGDAWLDPYRKDGRGTNVFVTRSKIADDIIRKGIDSKRLSVDELSLGSFKASQAGGFRHKQRAMSYRLEIQNKKHGLVPFKRKRLLQPIPFEFKIVQRQRIIIREKSLNVWRKTKSASQFDKEMKFTLIKLNILTKIYHKVQKLRNKLGFAKL